MRDSGLQGVGSVAAFVSRGLAPIPPHTGGGIGAMYQAAVRLGVDLKAMDFPPSMGARVDRLPRRPGRQARKPRG